MPDDISSLWSRVQLARHGSAVERCHAFPHLMRYSVGHHTLDVITLIVLCWAHDHDGAMPSAALLIRAALHDLPEGITGDVPSVVKDLMGGLDGVEAAVTEHLIGRAPACSLTDEEAEYLRWADRLELFLWVCEEAARGNVRFRAWSNGCFTELEAFAPPSMRDLALRAYYNRDREHRFLSWEHMRGVAGL